MINSALVITFLTLLFPIILAILYFYWLYRKKKYYRTHPEIAKKVILDHKLRKEKRNQFYDRHKFIIGIIYFSFVIYVIYKIFTPIDWKSFKDNLLQYDPKKPWTTFKSDINHDGKITITDVGSWFTWIFYLPGNCIVYALITNFPNLSEFFEISSQSYNSFNSGFISVIFWLSIFLGISNLKNNK